MKLIKRIKLKRVKYGDLDEGGEYCWDCMSFANPDRFLLIKGKDNPVFDISRFVTIPLDTTKYPPESVTYDIVGIEEKDFPKRADRGRHFSIWIEDESDTETIYE